jgi:hypothetical protein
VADGMIHAAHKPRGKVRGALPRIPARGIPPETPAAFPFCPMFQNGPRRQGFAAPRTNRAPLTAPGRSEDFPRTRERRPIQTQNPSAFAARSGLPLVGPELLNQFGVDKTS